MNDEFELPSLEIPTLKINERIQPILFKIEELIDELEEINVYSPFAVFKLPNFRNKRKSFKQEYESTLSECYDLLQEPVSGPGITMGFAQAWSTSKGLSAITKLQRDWQSADAILDRKYAYSIAICSLYIAVASMIITILSFF